MPSSLTGLTIAMCLPKKKIKLLQFVHAAARGLTKNKNN